jgi:hypothetical protein
VSGELHTLATLPLGRRVPGTHLTWGWVGLIAGLVWPLWSREEFFALARSINMNCRHHIHWSFVTTARPPTRPWKPQSLWLITTWLLFYCSPSSLLAGLSLLWFCFFSQNENETEGMTFWNSIRHPKGIGSGTRQHWGKWLPQSFWSVKRMMGSLYTFPMRLFWRRWQPKLSKLSQHFFFDLVRELFL